MELNIPGNALQKEKMLMHVAINEDARAIRLVTLGRDLGRSDNMIRKDLFGDGGYIYKIYHNILYLD